MREPPAGVTEGEVAVAVREQWDEAVVRAAHLPLGFGAHHWTAYDDTGPRLFVTLDRLEPNRTAAELAAAYDGAVALHAAGLGCVLPPLPSYDDMVTVPFAGGALSATRWVDGRRPDPFDLGWTAEALRALHAAAPPAGLPTWRPLVDSDLADLTAELVQREWGPGPFAAGARDAVRRRLGDLARWTDRYHHLAALARDREWVATHGEPHGGNQLVTGDAHVLVDWESLRLAPAERDLRTLVDAGAEAAEVGAHAEMLELFDLEWRLDEIHQYSAWFAAEHAGTEDDRIAYGGLLHELKRG